MNDIKVSLSIELQGSQLLSKEECLKTTQKEWIDKKGHKRIKSIQVEDWDKMNTHSFFTEANKKKGIKSERVVYHTRKCVPAKQHLNISKEAYYNMIDVNACPEWTALFIWKKLSKEQRLKAHMERIAEGLNGKLIEYHVFED